MSNERALRLRLEHFVKQNVHYAIFDKLSEDSTNRFYEKMTILFCKEYSPTATYGIKKAEVKTALIEMIARLNKGLVIDLNNENYYVYKSFLNTHYIVRASTKKAAIETAGLATKYNVPASKQSFQQIAGIRGGSFVMSTGELIEIDEPYLNTINIFETEAPK
ncbi:MULTISPECIES: hypothetical protein [Peribacillus]|uniref:hypothetical protein n=1 Tax=Peribacillus TaxID=2675229 RepID=UPI001F4E8110|nr:MULTISPECIES: hypothetical protein [unclassified Peribacillus]MCK1985181.1 hypothetical protein [Peribacillus sp. Aquil_B1]MCK2007169.1 hypothetical protein [Peribacillus sp. Aquil_B8]